MRRHGRFEELPVWQASKKLALRVYEATKQPGFARDFGLSDQVRRASVSVMSNIAEGYERETDRELNRFLAMAKGSAGEVRSQLHLAKDLGYVDEGTFTELQSSALDISRQIAGFMRYLRKPTQEATLAAL